MAGTGEQKQGTNCVHAHVHVHVCAWCVHGVVGGVVRR